MIDHFISSTLVSLVAVGAVLMLRHDRAAVRHAVLFAAIVRFAIPTSWLRIDFLPPIEPMLLHARPVTVAITRAATHPAPTRFDWRIVWAFGAAVCLSHWASRAFRHPKAVRPPTPEESQAFPGVPLRIVAPGHVPGACGVFRPVVVLPDGLADHLTPLEMNALVAHEMAHVRRHDNMTAAIAHSVVSIFWFHPLLWWLERRLLEERETACDESVLGQGIGAQEYCAGIAKVCRMSVATAGYAGANGSNLQKRMEHIMSGQLTLSSSRFLRAAAGVLIAAAAVVPIVRAQTAPRQAYVDAEKFMSAGQADEAIARLQKEVAANPGDRDLQIALGNLLVRAKRYDDAARVLEGVLDSIPSFSEQRADIYLRLGETYRRKGDDGSAIGALTKARQLAPEKIEVISTLALTLDHAGRNEEAEKAYREALALQPDNGVALNNLAYLRADSDEAMDLAGRAKKALPNSLEVTDTMGWIHLKAGRPGEAVKSFAEVVLQSPGTVPFREHLAVALEQVGGSPELVALLRTAPSAETEGKLKELVRNLPR
jgi:Flp pilus assembly protein TadD